MYIVQRGFFLATAYSYAVVEWMRIVIGLMVQPHPSLVAQLTPNHWLLLYAWYLALYLAGFLHGKRLMAQA